MSQLNTLCALAIAPYRQGDHLSQYVIQAVKVIQDSGLSYQTHAMTTEIEGDLDEVMAVVTKAAKVLAENGIRTEISFRADIRPGRENAFEQKKASLAREEKKLADKED
ncbi:thiamine-binding protein [Aerococcus sanguinicola]|uniref:thiamine-binding protein n=1 Tax=Aerococcus sanguinicola TaxID=119206 RepID=UPI0018A78507|nr:thiamine-binding protein [Aerococcus sanguinicola]